MMNPRLTAVLSAAAVMVSLAAPASGNPSRVDEAAGQTALAGPVGVSVSAGSARVSWTPLDSGSLSGYRIQVVDSATDDVVGQRVVGASTTDVVFDDLPRWSALHASVNAIGEDLSEVEAGTSSQFRILSTLSLVDDTPIVLTGDGTNYRTYSIRRKFRLDAPMPIDVYIQPTVVAFEGNAPHGLVEEPNSSWPVAVDDMPILIPAGTTTGWYQIYHWGDDWRRFEWAHWSFGFTTWDNPRFDDGWIELDDAVQRVTMYEDDEHFHPAVLMDARSTVRAGQTARVRVRLNVPAIRRTEITYRLRDHSARSGRDYVGRRGRVVVRKGAKVGWIEIDTRRSGSRTAAVDRRPGDRTFQVRLGRVEKQLARLGGRASTTVRIRR